MLRTALVICIVFAPALARSETAAPTAAEPTAEEGGDPGATAPIDPPGIPGDELTVAFVRGAADLAAGDRISPPRAVEISSEGCLRLVAGDAVALAFCGPASFEVEAREGHLGLRVTAGRGLLAAGEGGAAIEIGGERLVAAGATVLFEAGATPEAQLLGQGQARLGDRALEPQESPNADDELLSPWWCAPQRPVLMVRLGDPSELVDRAAQARREREEGGEEETTAEGGATCLDAADSSTASDVSDHDSGELGPDVQENDTGRLRVVIELPGRD